MTTLVLQSHRQPPPAAWLATCMDSVRDWARRSGFEYLRLGDELFAPLSASLRDKTRSQPIVATDLARLLWLERKLAAGMACVVWVDADFLVFDPARLTLPATDFALGREVWVQHDREGQLRAYPKVHNAFMVFRRGNAFVGFYRASIAQMLARHEGPVAPQFAGPKFLTALHNIVGFPVVEEAGCLSPPVAADILAGGGAALDLMVRRSRAAPAGANLCHSLADAGSETYFEALIDTLIANGGCVVRRTPRTLR